MRLTGPNGGDKENEAKDTHVDLEEGERVCKIRILKSHSLR